ncbi:phage/plasmid primase, P4 family [Nocardiopsis tropica]|uniref:phage/plasmid primase, P4 family n=1 Tax=Nocardiopsis tropica TaxID=109330 RepID=UPI002E82ED16|nr:phage/plasmid primase, P4 family [Nocardiopsis tropica]
MTERSATLDAANAFHAAGVCVVRAAANGTKAPYTGSGGWRTYMDVRPGEEQLDDWFADGHPGIGIVTGRISGGLVALDVEGRAVAEGVFQRYVELADHSGLGDVLRNQVMAGYTESTASGGLHLLWRIDDGEGVENLKLARRPSTAEELAAAPKQKIQVLIETKSEGGFLVVAPSHGPVHPTGRPWEMRAGGPDTIVTLDRETSDALLELARMLDAMPVAELPPAFSQPSTGQRPDGGLSPGDDYEARTDWTDILTPHGWVELPPHGHTRYWRRPGKSMGISATTGHDPARDRLYVFTTSTEFDSETPFTKFWAYTLLEHGGDGRAAARALSAAGFGRPVPEPVRHLSAVPTPFTRSGRAPATDGAAALKVDEPAPVAQLDTYSRTDDGNALRLVDEHATNIRYVPERGKWLVWDGHRWGWDDRGHVPELARAIARNLPDDGKEDAAHKARSLAARNLGAMVQLARTDPRVVAPAAQLDADPHLLNTTGGVVDLKTGTLAAPDPAQLHTRSATAAPDPATATPRWDTFLADTFGGDAEIIGYVQRLAGYSASADTGTHVLPFLHGGGSNGKSVLLDVLRALLGDYASSAPHDFLMNSRSSHETELARLQGMRLVICSEVNAEDRFDEAKMKALTGGDVVTARFMRQDHFTFEPTHHLWLMGNHQPEVKTGGTSFWRRLRLVPFLHTVPPEKRVENLARILVGEEGPGILAWVVEGARQYFASGLADPTRVKAATDKYASEEDHVGRFLEECCHASTSAQVKQEAKALRAAYESWCTGEGIKPLNAQSLGRELTGRGHARKASNGRKFYEGLALIDDGTEDDRRAGA